jgi:hypothetical protein
MYAVDRGSRMDPRTASGHRRKDRVDERAADVLDLP